MPQTDLLDELLTANPNEPATNAAVLLLRAEMRSEFKPIKADIAQLKTDVAGLKTDVAELKGDVAGLKTGFAGMQRDISKIHSSLELVAQQVAILVARK